MKYAREVNNPGRGKPPPVSFKELCDLFGVKHGQLRAAMRNSDSTPKYLFYSGSTVRNKWYDRAAMVRWWNERGSA